MAQEFNPVPRSWKWIGDSEVLFTYDGTYWVLEGDWDSINKQDTLVSGTNIKTINGASILGSGNITIEGGRDITTVYVDLMDKKGKYIDTVVR